MYLRSAPYFDDLYDFLDYDAAAAQVHEAIQRRRPSARTLLDVGCGTGRHLAVLHQHYDVEGLDITEALLATARRRCPQVRFHLGNMQDFELHRQFDVVTCLFSAIAYVKTAQALEATISTLARHLNPNGIVIVEPWFTPDQYDVGRPISNEVSKPGLHITWAYSNALEQGLAIQNIHFLVDTPAGRDQFIERHELGLFSEQDFRLAFTSAGLALEHRPEGLFGRGMYFGTRSGQQLSTTPKNDSR